MGLYAYETGLSRMILLEVNFYLTYIYSEVQEIRMVSLNVQTCLVARCVL